MKILTVDARSTNQTDIALPFETDEEVVAAWGWLLSNKYLDNFSYRPRAEGVDLGRAFTEAQLVSHQNSNGSPLPPVDARHVRAIIGHLYQDDLHHSVREVINPMENATG
ncbi:hypothetical protein [Arthrobacter sp. H14]|uniref:hypothetical protein n=1 Tax=Arthrobacter sp. H14 TaxID=1312959 RepID=UPI0004B22118|nr:hypothetical protein [Arthrobacter sp. H14]